MNRIVRFILGSKQEERPSKSVCRTVKSSKMTIEETIRRYEQLTAK